MADPNKKIRLRIKKPSAKTRSHYITKKGNRVKLHSNFQSRWQAKRDARARKRAAYLATLPKNRFKRILYRMHPKRAAQYWFSREGGIMALKLTGVGILAVFLLLVGVFAYFRKDLPNLRDISGNNIGGSIRYYDRTGKVLLWEDYDAVKRNPVQDDDISQKIKDATVAIEDKDFFNHSGFDVKGIVRAGVNNYLGDGGQQGGSTITQQLVKLTQNWTKDRTYARKIKELILSVELERTYSKQEILTGYLNTAPYGDIQYGVEAAMRDYFQKNAKDMTLDEAAFLAAIPKSPSVYSPYGARFNRQELIGRQHYILDLMQQQGYITAKERDKSKKVNTLKKIKPRKPKYSNIRAPWFVLTAKERLIEERGAETVKLGGLKVTTTLDLNKQKVAEKAIADGMYRVRAQGGDTAALVSEDVKTGQVVALVGGPDFQDPVFGQNNYARLKLPPGSSFKPYDYISLIENTDQFGAGSVLYDEYDSLPGYPCTDRSRDGNCLHNYDFRTPGPLTLRYALGGSRNIPAVKAMLIAGVDKTIKTAGKLGLEDTGNENIKGSGYHCYSDEKLTKESQCYASSAIGDGAYLKLDEHVHAFSTISRNGRLIPQTYILKIEDARGKVIDEWKPSEGKQAVRPQSAYIVADILSDPRASYMARKSHEFNGWKFSMKTGTTNDSKDGWMMGFSTRYSTGIWVGYHNRTVEMSGFMESMTQPIWVDYMYKVHENLEPEEREKPKGIQELPAYVVRSHVGASSIEPGPSTDLFPSWYKKGTRNKNATIDKVSNKLATDCTPPLARITGYNAQANEFSGDKFHGGGGGYSTSTNEKDDIHNCEDAKPIVTLSAPGSCTDSCIFTATVRQGTHPISSAEFPGTLNFYVDGNQVASRHIGASPDKESYKYKVAVSGKKTVRAQIIDSVLYDSSDSRSVSFSSNNESEDFEITGASAGGGDVTASWDGGSGTVKVYREDNDHLICQASASAGVCSGSWGPGGEPDGIYARSGSEEDEYDF
ncbi:MAG TPA: transglycosylase domain-containing protein [Candidatus Saccharimonadales bacterium]|nr:transglycosylase domain-containing protein [Candidatus Saccharimonadales bacterium]